MRCGWQGVLKGAMLGVVLPVLAQAQAQAVDAPPPLPAAPSSPGASAGDPDVSAPRAAQPLPGNVPDGMRAPVLTIDQDVIYTASEWGLRAQAHFEREARALAAENDRLAEQLSREEAELTERRKTMAADQFRALAEAFDQRATKIRDERAEALRVLNQHADADRKAFRDAVFPIIGGEMQVRGAVVVLDQRTVFVSLQGIDITSVVVERINAELGDGSEYLKRAQSTGSVDDSAP